MEFCPKCETRLLRKKDESSLICPKCGKSKEKTDQIIFNSNWSKKRFLIGLDDYKYNSKISVIYF